MKKRVGQNNDLYLNLLLMTAVIEISKKINDQKEASDNDVYASNSENRIMVQKIISKHFRNQNIKKRVKKYSLRAALVCLLFYLVFSICIFSVSAWRKPVIDFFLQTTSPYSTIQTQDGLYINHESAYFPQRIPEGFIVNKYSASDSVISLEYANSQNQMIVFTQQDSNTGAMIDTEDVQSQDIRLANGLDALFIEKQDTNQLIWEVEPYILILQSNLSKDEMLEIANSVPNK